MRQDFEGGVYWDELADRCGNILRAAGFQGAARFRGNTVYYVQNDLPSTNVCEREKRVHFISLLAYGGQFFLMLGVLGGDFTCGFTHTIIFLIKAPGKNNSNSQLALY